MAGQRTLGSFMEATKYLFRYRVAVLRPEERLDEVKSSNSVYVSDVFINNYKASSVQPFLFYSKITCCDTSDVARTMRPVGPSFETKPVIMEVECVARGVWVRSYRVG